MEGTRALTIRIEGPKDSDAEELAEAARHLRATLLTLDVNAVDHVVPDNSPLGAKGTETIIGTLVIAFTAPAVLKSVMDIISEWSLRTDHTIEVSLGADTLKLTGVTAAQQERIIDDFLRRQDSPT